MARRTHIGGLSLLSALIGIGLWHSCATPPEVDPPLPPPGDLRVEMIRPGYVEWIGADGRRYVFEDRTEE